jgi:ribosomal protein S14
MRSEFFGRESIKRDFGKFIGGPCCSKHTSVPIKILGRYVIFRNLPCTDLGDRIRHMFDTVNRACLKNCPSWTSSFTLSRVRFRAIRESLIVAGLAGGIRSGVFRFMLLVHVLTEICYRPRASLRSFYTLSRQGAPFSRPSQLSTTKESSVIAR